MKQKGGLPPVFVKKPYTEEDYERAQRRFAVAVKKSIPPEPQTERKGLTQFFKRPRSPFTGPGPSTAGRKKLKRNRTRKMRR
jgi:hypothetical protein